MGESQVLFNFAYGRKAENCVPARSRRRSHASTGSRRALAANTRLPTPMPMRTATPMPWQRTCWPDVVCGGCSSKRAAVLEAGYGYRKRLSKRNSGSSVLFLGRANSALGPVARYPVTSSIAHLCSSLPRTCPAATTGSAAAASLLWLLLHLLLLANPCYLLCAGLCRCLPSPASPSPSPRSPSRPPLWVPSPFSFSFFSFRSSSSSASASAATFEFWRQKFRAKKLKKIKNFVSAAPP